jgi:hypothetical protein
MSPNSWRKFLKKISNNEKKDLNRLVKERITGRIEKMPTMDASLFPEDMELKVWDEIREKLKEIDIARLTPLEALNILQFLKTKSDSFQKIFCYLTFNFYWAFPNAFR